MVGLRRTAGLRSGPMRVLGGGLAAVEHRITVPLDYSRVHGEEIELFAREYRRADARADDLPWLLYLQGGPGCSGTRHLSLGGWLSEATRHARVLMLDQRGTGLSHPINRHTLGGSAREQADVLRLMRADSIVRDAESLREALGVKHWYTQGQSYGGFITGTYLSSAPESLAGCMITGGLPPVTAGVDDVYEATYRSVARRQDEFFTWYPEDEEALQAIYRRVRDADERVDGHRLRPGHVQRLGMLLGGNGRVHGLHYLLAEAFERRSDGDLGLTDAFKRQVWQQFSQETTPLYTVMHETIYAETEATRWAAARVAEAHSDFAESADCPRLTGEMILPWHVRDDPATAPLWEAADLLARTENMGPLYDRDQLARNVVPVAACVYTHDIYVDRELSLATASAIQGTQVYERSDLHHDGIAQDGAAVFRELARRIGLLRSEDER